MAFAAKRMSVARRSALAGGYEAPANRHQTSPPRNVQTPSRLVARKWEFSDPTPRATRRNLKAKARWQKNPLDASIRFTGGDCRFAAEMPAGRATARGRSQARCTVARPDGQQQRLISPQRRCYSSTSQTPLAAQLGPLERTCLTILPLAPRQPTSPHPPPAPPETMCVPDKARPARRAQSKHFDREDIDARVKAGELLIIIKDKVYNLTNWVKYHPGGDLPVWHLK
ncbi:hypothetical protein BDK51DRAFT_41616, partial [Blyttiomyces helicus]